MEVSISTNQQYCNMQTPVQYSAPNLTGLGVPFTPKQFNVPELVERNIYRKPQYVGVKPWFSTPFLNYPTPNFIVENEVCPMTSMSFPHQFSFLVENELSTIFSHHFPWKNHGSSPYSPYVFPWFPWTFLTAFRSPPVTQNWAPGQALRDNVMQLLRNKSKA